MARIRAAGQGDSAARNLPNHNLAATGRREEQRFKGGSFPFAADAFGGHNQADEQAKGDSSLERYQLPLALGGSDSVHCWLPSGSAVIDISTLNRIKKLSTRPPIHSSVSSRLHTSHHTGDSAFDAVI